MDKEMERNDMSKTKKRVLLLPVIIALGFIPMIVRMHTYNTGLSVFDWFPDAAEQQVDFFLWYKMQAIILTAVVMCCMLAYSIRKDKKMFQWHNSWYCLAAYGVLSFMSALFSPYRSFAFKGSYEVFESLWVVLGYVIMCFYAYQMIQNEQDAEFVAKYAAIGIVIITLIGFFQYLGKDFFRTTFGKKLITDSSMWGALDELSFTFPLKTSYTTLYNTNYLAFYYGLLIPILVILILFAKNVSLKLTCAVLALLCFVTMIGSNSKSALLALGMTFVLGCIVLRRYLKKYFWVPLAAVILFAGMITLYANRLGGFGNLYQALFVGVQTDLSSNAIRDIDTLDSEIVFKLDDKELHLAYDVSESGQIYIYAFDHNGDMLTYQQDGNGTFVLDDLSYADCRITPMYLEDKIALQVTMDDLDWYFAKLEDGTYYYYNAMGKFTKIPDVKVSTLFPNNIISGRGALWNRIVPILKSNIILGTGSNTFVIAYPQADYITKKYVGTENLFDVKAHSFYFQQFVENGLLALLALLAFYGWYFVDSFKLYSKIKNFSFCSMVGLGIMLGTFNYMIIAVANDSNVNTAPVFWILLGAGMAMNRIVSSEK